jgi:hypothetical protein
MSKANPRFHTIPGSPCPTDPEDAAERYLLGRMVGPEAEHYEDHYITCRLCTEHLEETQLFIEACRRTLAF